MKEFILGADEHPFGMSTIDFKKMGQGDIAYVKKYNVKGELAFVLHGADGTAVAVQKDVEAILYSAHQQELDIVAIH